MRSRNLGTRIAWLMAFTFLLGGWAQADYVMHGRVSYDAGNTLVKGANEADWSNAGINTLILSKDTLWVDSGGTAEVEFPGGNFLRMADASKVEVQSVSPTLSLRGWAGSFYVQRISRSTGDVVLETPAGTIRVAKDTNLRVDVLEDGATAITVRWGAATVRALSGHESSVGAGQRVWVEPGMLPSEAVRFSSSNDDAFDLWNRERAEWLAKGPEQTPIQVSDKTIGATELSRYGEWVVIDNRSYWRPTVVREYVPYRHGRWSYTAGIGHVWVGMYPFSYVTTHYGYWDYVPRYGWVWGYHDVWSPAWVATVRYGDYFVWSPINRYHRPVLVTDSAYFNIGGVQFSLHASSYVPSSYLYWGPSRIRPTYGPTFQNIYNSGNITNINIWNINVSGRGNHVRVPYESDFAQMTRNYNPSRTIRGTVSSPTDQGRSAHNRVSALESRIGRDSFSVRGRDTAGNVRTAVDSRRATQGRSVRLQEDTPAYLRDMRQGRTVNAEEVRASVRDRQAIPSGRSAGVSVRDDATRTPGRDATVRGGAQTPDRSERLTRVPDADRNGAAGVRSGVTTRGAAERGSTGRETVDRGAVRQQPTGVTPRSSTQERGATQERTSAPSRGAAQERTSVPERSAPSERGTTTVRQQPSQSQPRATTPQRTADRPRVQVGDPVDRSSTTRSSVRSQDERPRATQTTPRATTTPNRSAERAQPQTRSSAPTTPRATTPNRSAERAQPQTRSSVPTTPRATTPDRSTSRQAPSSVRTAPSTSRSQATPAPQQRATAPQQRSTASSVSRPSASAPSSSAQRAPQPSSSNVRSQAAPRSAPSRGSSSVTPRSIGGNRPSVGSSSSSAPSRSSGISSRSSSAPSRSSSVSAPSSSRSSSVSAPSRSSSSRGASISPRSSGGGAPARGGR